MDETLVIEQVIARLQTLEEGTDISTAMYTGTMCDASAFVCYCHNAHRTSSQWMCGRKRWRQRGFYGRSPNGFGCKIVDNDRQPVLMTK